jgi:hypothetical protein
MNEIPGVAVPEDGIRRRPSIKLTALRDERALNILFESLAWAISEVKGPSNEHEVKKLKDDEETLVNQVFDSGSQFVSRSPNAEVVREGSRRELQESRTLEFEAGSEAHIDWVSGAPTWWLRSKYGSRLPGDRANAASRGSTRGYKEGRDFFYVNWQIDYPKNETINAESACEIRLQVGSPNDQVDAVLNRLKRDVINSLRAVDWQDAAEAAGYRYIAGAMVNDHQIKKFKNTTVFKLACKDGKNSLTGEEMIKAVDDAHGRTVDEVLARFTERIDNRFPL